MSNLSTTQEINGGSKQIEKITSKCNIIMKQEGINQSYFTAHITLELLMLPLWWLYFDDRAMRFGCFMIQCSSKCQMFSIDTARTQLNESD